MCSKCYLPLVHAVPTSKTSTPFLSEDADKQGETMNTSRKEPSGTGWLCRALGRSLTGLGIVMALCSVYWAKGYAAEPIKPMMKVEVDAAKVALGKRLFHDPILSKDNTISCASCHNLSSGGDDGQVVSTGIEGRSGRVNAPTVLNASFNFKQFWDGRAPTLKAQIDGPVQNRLEMESIWPEVVTKLFQNEDYPRLFQQSYSDSITRENIKDAIAEFMRSLTTPNSRFDRWLQGDASAINGQEKHGYVLFKRYGCVSCHQGASVGGNMFQVFGVINDYFKKRGNITEADLGRFNVTGNIADRHAFKVPSLRMAAHTAPYLHDGSAATLRDAVDAMFEFQLGREAPDEDKEAIVAFIETLAGNPIDPDFLPGAVAAADGVPSAPAQGSRGKGGRVGQRAVAAAEEVLPAPAQGSRGKGGRVGQRAVAAAEEVLPAPAQGSRGKGGRVGQR